MMQLWIVSRLLHAEHLYENTPTRFTHRIVYARRHELLSEPSFWWTLKSCCAAPAVMQLLISGADFLSFSESYRASLKKMS